MSGEYGFWCEAPWALRGARSRFEEMGAYARTALATEVTTANPAELCRRAAAARILPVASAIAGEGEPGCAASGRRVPRDSPYTWIRGVRRAMRCYAHFGYRRDNSGDPAQRASGTPSIPSPAHERIRCRPGPVVRSTQHHRFNIMVRCLRLRIPIAEAWLCDPPAPKPCNGNGACDATHVPVQRRRICAVR